MHRFATPVRRPEEAGAGKCLQQRTNIVAQFAIADAGLLQDMPRQHIKIELRRNLKMSGVRKNRVDQLWMIENRIARFRIAQKIDKRNLVSLRTRQRAHDEVEIGGCKPRPTIRPDHRDFIMRD